MSPTVSIILPTHNRAKTLKRAIDSVLLQTFTDFELIVVDDGSTDETAQILREFDAVQQIQIVTQTPEGCSSARNRGVRNAQGSYIAFQDSDDEWLSNKLEEAIRCLENSEPTVGVFYSDMIRVNTDQTNSYWKSPNVIKGILIDEERLDYQVAGIGMSSAVVRRECFDKVGFFDESLMRFSDLEFFIRLSDHYDFFHYQKPLLKYYAGPSISTDVAALVQARRYLIEKYSSRLAEHKHHLVAQYLHLEIAEREMRIEELELAALTQFVDQGLQHSLWWPLINFYGRLKYPYLLPVYRLMGLANREPRK